MIHDETQINKVPSKSQDKPFDKSFDFSMDLPQLPTDRLPTLAEWNSRYIDFVLNYTKGKKTAAARILGINRRTLYRRNKSKTHDVQDEMGEGFANGTEADVADESRNRQVEH